MIEFTYQKIITEKTTLFTYEKKKEKVYKYERI